ncbi:NUDIX domain-containing protein [Paracoccus spongiarum]|uniref:NUDIX domain-containing protein n=1 Tax=Paracoccus spongiarum TaxID=3064387 RepID=A0ABT9JBL6_9RHOB|nr:NUDIX domain-containing protein [Paracoccus sp. 2205BS29-5]MDP5307203.1 NUDIX domain-containing protein [Paracoccus sp. 2205BS29-5]
MSHAPGEPPIRDAATMMLLRRSAAGASILMGMRGATAAFMPSKYVFPGGAVDAEDAGAMLARGIGEPHRRRLMAEPRNGQPADPDAIAAAALRELAEETGLLIGTADGPHSGWPGYAETGISPDAGTLVYLFRAITPPGRPRRFDAHFLVADAAAIAGDPDDFGRACDELSHLHWVPLAEARALNLPFITEVVLAELAELVHAVPHHADLPLPDTVPFFDNRGPAPRFAQIA